MEVLKNLDDNQTDRYMKLERVFESDGWPLLEEWFTQKAEVARQRAAHANSWDENRIAVGQEGAYTELVNLRDSTMQQFEVAAEANLDREQEDEEDEAIAHQS